MPELTLKDKITTYDDYLHVVLPNGRTVQKEHMQAGGRLALTSGYSVHGVNEIGVSSEVLPNMVTGALVTVPATLWWMHREHLRIVHRVYPGDTSVMQRLRTMVPWSHMMPHVSASDPEQIAYTPSIEYGQNDRQVTMALGRFLRKTFLMMTDTTIAAIEARHRLELHPDVEFIVALDRPTEFLSAYMKLTSCMAKPLSNFNTPFHPVHSYCMPGWQLAILKSGSHISARSMVWVNPAEPKDKRMVRTYGDVMLHSWLQAQGFVLRSFEGAQLKTAIVQPGISPGDPAFIVCPYIDSGGGHTHNGYGLWDGHETITLRDMVTHRGGDRRAEYLFTVQNQNGKQYAKPFVTERTCALSGQTASTLKHDFVLALIKGEPQFALLTEVEERHWIRCRTQNETTLYAPPETPVFEDIHRNYLDTPQVRISRGFAKLDIQWYPEEQGWVRISSAGIVHGSESRAGGSGPEALRWMKREHAIKVIQPNSSIRTLHMRELPAGSIRVGVMDTMKMFAGPEVTVVRTTTGRKVVPGVHPICKGWDQQWHFTRTMRQTQILGEYVFVPKEGLLFAGIDFDHLPDVHERFFQGQLETRGDWSYRDLLQRCIFGVFARAVGEMYAPGRRLDNGYIRRIAATGYEDIDVAALHDYLDQESYEVPYRIEGMRPTAAHQFWYFGRLIRRRIVAALFLPTTTETPHERVEAPGTGPRSAAAPVDAEVCEPVWTTPDGARYSPLPHGSTYQWLSDGTSVIQARDEGGRGSGPDHDSLVAPGPRRTE